MIRLHRISIILTIVLIFGQYPLALAQNDNSLVLGFQKLEEREYKDAIDLFTQVLDSEPSDTAALSGIIRASLLSNNLRSAQKYIDNAIRLHPNNPEFLLREGILNNLKGDYDKAIISFRKGITLSKSSVNIQFFINRGVSHMQLEKYEDAAQDFTDALEINPRNASALNYRAFSNYRLGLFEESIADYNQSIDLNPENAAAFYNRGMAYLRFGDKQKACPDFHKACSMGNKNACRMIMTECTTGGRR